MGTIKSLTNTIIQLKNIGIGEIQLRPYLNELQAKTWGHLAYAIRYSKWNQGYGTLFLKKALEKATEENVNNVNHIRNS